jgi:hypothetical protein
MNNFKVIKHFLNHPTEKQKRKKQKKGKKENVGKITSSHNDDEKFIKLFIIFDGPFIFFDRYETLVER